MANPAIVSYPTRGQAPEIFALRLKFTSKFQQSLQQMIRLIRVNLFIRRPLIELFRPPDKTRAISPQLGLFYA